MKTPAGFTLLEVLVAVAITAMIGVAASQLLRSVINAKQATDVNSEQLVSLQRFNMVLGRDIEQMVNRPVRDEYGNKKDALLLDSGEYPIEFTRNGWRNSPVAKDPRSTLQRVAYRLESMDSEVCKPAFERLQKWGMTKEQTRGDCLVRYFWQVLDQSGDSEPKAQVVLEQVKSLEMDVLVEKRRYSKGQPAQIVSRDWSSIWPILQGGNDEEVPVAIRWRLDLPRLGQLERSWLIAYEK